jgi:metallo-beta-lactamase family protein
VSSKRVGARSEPQASAGGRATLRFLGGAGTVTGSKYLVQTPRGELLLDCGLFQGRKDLRLRNWEKLDFDVRRLDAIVLSHAHIDHSGYLPLMVRHGYSGPVYCSPGTASLLHALLPDSAKLQEEDAERANRRGYSKHHPALPLYTSEDAEAALELLETRAYGKAFEVMRGATLRFHRAGHILGSCSIELELEGRRPTTLVFSGDLGRWDRPILRDPELVPRADVLLVESTYGDRRHGANAADELARVVTEAAERGGALVIPSFAVGRTQELIWTLRTLEEQRRIPALPLFVDSPLALAVTEAYCRHDEDHDEEMKARSDAEHCPLCNRQYFALRTREESKALNRLRGPLIILSASGMATGGRVLHHLAQRLPDERTTVLLPGYQAAGTRGRALQEGAAHVRIHGQDIPVRAAIETLDVFSAHADQEEILRWLRGFEHAPRATYAVHGEPEAAEGLVAAIRERLGWRAQVARDGEELRLRA